ncbi:ribokinase [Emticicia agri]|uniref:Ribokinase n=1 Tax=Emticicia agri TaxID=2492393 RepID=A0A4Q5LVL3_9BACT|nr:ribokinase [Emticicia agri]RYU93781.1 ribokinase [Emticicia agri]
MSKIVVIGSSNTDMVVKTNRFPNPGETILGGTFFMFAGGKGANQAVAAARMGGDVVLVAKVGNDIFGKQAIEGFQKEKINTSYISTDFEKASGTALIIVNERGENKIVVASGSNDTLSQEDIMKAATEIEMAEVVLLQLEIPVSSVVFAATQGLKTESKVILNPAPAQELPDEIYPNLYLITPNETEAQLLTGIEVKDDESAREAADMLLDKGVRNVIITLGARGAYFHNDYQSFFVDAPQVEAVDTTAAGDIFNGTLAVALAQKKDWRSAIELACKVASLSVTRMGAQASAPFLSEISSASDFYF